MPAHTVSKSEGAAARKTVTKPTCGAGRSAVTGRPLGKAAIRALTKNAEAVEEVVEICDRAATAEDLQERMERAALILAKVSRTVGGGRVLVLLQDGEEVSVPIGGSIKMKGKAATKTDRANCMCQGDYVVVRGGIAAGKMSPATVTYVRQVFADLMVAMPKGFFPSADADDMFDRTDQAAAEAVMLSEIKAAKARASALRSGVAVAETEETDAVDVDAI
jgi:hypothetical protein